MSTQYDYWIYQQLEPDDILHTGNAKQHKPTMLAEKWAWIDSLTPDQRKQLRDESEQKYKNYDNENI